MSSFLCVITPMEQLLDRQTERQAEGERGTEYPPFRPAAGKQESERENRVFMRACVHVCAIVLGCLLCKHENIRS